MPADAAGRAWTRRRFLASGVALGGAAALVGCGLSRGSTPDNSAEPDPEGNWAGTLLDPPFEKPDLTFTDFDGEPFPFLESTEGQLTMLFFGYTNCPDICPVTLNTMARAREGIGTGPGSRPQVLFVGVDVARDTPEVLKAYLGNIDETFVGLTASEQVIAEAVRAVKGAPILIEEADENGAYAVGHPAQVTVYSPDNLGHRIYPSGVRQADWARDLPRLAKGEYR